MTATAGKPSDSGVSQKCVYCGGTGRWAKDVVAGKPSESVFCPHCHGSGVGGSSNSDLG